MNCSIDSCLRFILILGLICLLFISFRDRTPESNSPTEGDWVGWIGTYEDIVHCREGHYRTLKEIDQMYSDEIH